MTQRLCTYPTCDRTFTGPKNQRYCSKCTRRRWEKAEKHYKDIVAEGGERLRNLIALVWDEACARKAAQTPRADAGRTLTG